MSYIPPEKARAKLFVTSIPGFELDSASEIWHCLYKIGIEEDSIEIEFLMLKKRPARGFYLVYFHKEDPITAVRKIRQYLQKHPWILRYTERIVPTEIYTLDYKEFLDKLRKLIDEKIEKNDLWRITVNKRYTSLSSRVVISDVANLVHRGSVSLESPTRIIHIEIIQNYFMASIIKPSDIIRRSEFLRHIKKQSPLEPIHL